MSTTTGLPLAGKSALAAPLQHPHTRGGGARVGIGSRPISARRTCAVFVPRRPSFLTPLDKSDCSFRRSGLLGGLMVC
jgi:hypothetical protein